MTIAMMSSRVCAARSFSMCYAVAAIVSMVLIGIASALPTPCQLDGGGPVSSQIEGPCSTIDIRSVSIATSLWLNVSLLSANTTAYSISLRFTTIPAQSGGNGFLAIAGFLSAPAAGTRPVIVTLENVTGNFALLIGGYFPQNSVIRVVNCSVQASSASIPTGATLRTLVMALSLGANSRLQFSNTLLQESSGNNAAILISTGLPPGATNVIMLDDNATISFEDVKLQCAGKLLSLDSLSLAKGSQLVMRRCSTLNLQNNVFDILAVTIASESSWVIEDTTLTTGGTGSVFALVPGNSWLIDSGSTFAIRRTTLTATSSQQLFNFGGSITINNRSRWIMDGVIINQANAACLRLTTITLNRSSTVSFTQITFSCRQSVLVDTNLFVDRQSSWLLDRTTATSTSSQINTQLAGVVVTTSSRFSWSNSVITSNIGAVGKCVQFEDGVTVNNNSVMYWSNVSLVGYYFALLMASSIVVANQSSMIFDGCSFSASVWESGLVVELSTSSFLVSKSSAFVVQFTNFSAQNNYLLSLSSVAVVEELSWLLLRGNQLTRTTSGPAVRFTTSATVDVTDSSSNISMLDNNFKVASTPFTTWDGGLGVVYARCNVKAGAAMVLSDFALSVASISSCGSTCTKLQQCFVQNVEPSLLSATPTPCDDCACATGLGNASCVPFLGQMFPFDDEPTTTTAAPPTSTAIPPTTSAAPTSTTTVAPTTTTGAPTSTTGAPTTTTTDTPTSTTAAPTSQPPTGAPPAGTSTPRKTHSSSVSWTIELTRSLSSSSTHSSRHLSRTMTQTYSCNSLALSATSSTTNSGRLSFSVTMSMTASVTPSKSQASSVSSSTSGPKSDSTTPSLSHAGRSQSASATRSSAVSVTRHLPASASQAALSLSRTLHRSSLTHSTSPEHSTTPSCTKTTNRSQSLTIPFTNSLKVVVSPTLPTTQTASPHTHQATLSTPLSMSSSGPLPTTSAALEVSRSGFRDNTTSTLTQQIAAPIVTITNLEQAAQVTTKSVTVASAITSSPTSAVSMARLTAMQAVLSCELQLDVDDAVNLLALKFGPDDGDQARGAVVGNLLIVVICAFAMVAGILMAFQLRRNVVEKDNAKASMCDDAQQPKHRRSWSLSKTATMFHFPGAMAIPMAAVLQPTLASSVALFHVNAWGGDIPVGIIGMGICCGFAGWTIKVVLWRFPCELAPHPKYQARLDALLRRGGARLFLFRLLGASQHWTYAANPTWRKQHSLLFEDVRAPWYIAVDTIASVVIGVVTGLPKVSKAVCVLQASIFFIVYAMLVGALWFRPMLQRVMAGFCLIMNSIGFVAATALLLYAINKDAFPAGAQVVGTCALIMSFLALAKTISDIIEILLGLRAKMKKLTKFYKEGNPSHRPALRVHSDGLDEAFMLTEDNDVGGSSMYHSQKGALVVDSSIDHNISNSTDDDDSPYGSSDGAESDVSDGVVLGYLAPLPSKADTTAFIRDPFADDDDDYDDDFGGHLDGGPPVEMVKFQFLPPINELMESGFGSAVDGATAARRKGSPTFFPGSESHSRGREDLLMAYESLMHEE